MTSPAATTGAVVAPIVTPASAALAAIPQDTVSITPERVLAPVGSEVVLKASICTTEGYTLADQRVEWMLGRNGVGQFVEVSGKGWFHPPLLPWNKPKKVDNYLATGYTANGPLCVTRGTADPADDININRGDAWITVTSPNEGTSYVTAYTPTVESWDQRRSAATIYWVDVQWTFPPPTVAGGGRSATLTTSVTRQSNGTPLEGWIVRYELADGGGNLAGGAGGQVVEVRTDAEGRATVEATPTSAGAAASPVNIQLIRPAAFGGGDAPRLVIGTGSSVIQWGGSATPYLPPTTTSPIPTTPPSGSVPMTPPPTIPDTALPTTPPGGGWTPPSTGGAATPTIPTIPAARPQLELTLEGDEQAVAGGKAQLTMFIRNAGTAPATNVRVVDRLDSGLMDPRNPDSREVEFVGVGTVLAGETKRHTVLFDVMQAGRLCHNFTVSCAEGAESSARHCVTASQPTVERVGRVEVRKEAPVQGVVGETVLFRVTVKNVGELPLVDVRVVDEYPTAFFQARPLDDLNAQVVSGTISHTIQRMEVGTTQTFRVECLCLRAERPVLPRPRVLVTAGTDPPTQTIQMGAEVDMEILPPRAAASATGDGGSPAAGPAAPLKVETTFFNQQPRVGSRATCQVAVVNSSTMPDEAVELRVVLPAQLAPDLAALQAPPNVQATQVGDQLRFTPVAMLRPGERIIFTIPMTVSGPAGFAEVVADVRSRNLPTGAPRQVSLEILGQ